MTPRDPLSCLLVILIIVTLISALPDQAGVSSRLAKSLHQSYESLWPTKWGRSLNSQKRDDSDSGTLTNPDGTPFIWLPQDTYAGQTFFDEWDFFDVDDPTHYVNKSTAQEMGLFWVADNGTVFMKADDTSVLPFNASRASIRITSQKIYTTGLFILDLNRAPWGCAIWPAFWTFGNPWPHVGEIDILEGVHDNEHNQITWHTDAGCIFDTNATFTGQVGNTDCVANETVNIGCDVVEWSRASYGPFFESQGGGVLAMKWDENDISVWSFFRAAIPADITAGTPNPSLWGVPSAMLRNTMCDIPKYFANHSIVFDITFCGVWAGNSYATSGCPGTCADRIMDPANFENATWSINSLKVYRKQVLAVGHGNTSAASSLKLQSVLAVLAGSLIIPVFLLLV
ncbi:putative glycosidase C21B10.07 [Psilocybe cubensis]|uniref:Glycosidase C21B10.07 n=2 Tax=Psilocybe cubensis TaxID=181762 RepID=A0ACB8GI15_PSICU|nr:putative glycosidase C21B10.07 [Psilocybe cubensis]KAH9475198.1 putative glycosidase C21B10.07 [Psilocybe cubensis]